MSRRFVSSSYQSFSQSRRRPHAPVLATVRLAPRSTVPFLPLNPSHPPLLRPPLMLSPTAAGKARAPIEVITIEDSDDEVEAHGGDEEMERAIAMSLASARAEGVELPSTSAGTSAAGSKKRDASGSAVRDQGVGGSAGGGCAPREETRAEMEAARQARVRQREEAGLSNAPAYAVRAAVKRPRVGTINDIPHEGASTSSSSASGSRSFHSGGTGSDASASTARKEERFWQGAIRRVSNKFVPTAADSFSFNEIVDAKGEELERAFVSSMCYEPEWILDQFPNNAPLLLVNPHPKGAPDQRGVQAVPGRSNTALVFATDRSWPTPWPNSHFTMHVKAVVLYYKAFCRIIIPTANLMSYDWDQLENMFYVQDFPMLPADPHLANPRQTTDQTQFCTAFARYLQQLNVPDQYLNPLRRYDFSASRDSVRLVQTTQGRHDGWDEMEKGGGICSLATAVASFGFPAGGTWEIELATSSMGQFSAVWLTQLLAACSGIHPRTYYRGSTHSTPAALPKPAGGKEGMKLPIKFVFPTLAEVSSSICGINGGGTIFCDRKHWDSYPRHVFHKFQSKREGIISHTKTIVAIRKPKKSDGVDSEYVGWVYVGSHNATTSAWGQITTTAATGVPKTSNMNYEMGVIVPLRGRSVEDVQSQVDAMVHYQRPLERYEPADVPWMQKEHIKQ